MYNYVLKEVKEQFPLQLWVVISLVVAVLLFFVDQTHDEKGNLIYTIFNQEHFIFGKGEVWLNYYYNIALFLFVIAVPKVITDLLSPKRISLILYKPYSRIDVLLHTVSGVFVGLMIFIAVNLSIILISSLFSLGTLSLNFILSHISFSIALLLFFCFLFFLAVVFRSYATIVLIGIIYLGIVSPFLANHISVLSGFGISNESLNLFLDALNIFMPRVSEAVSFSVQIYSNGEIVFLDFAWIIFSGVPAIVVGAYLMNKKDF